MIAVFSGTSDGRFVVDGLLSKGHPVACFNATPYGGSLYEEHPKLKVFTHMMTYEELKIRCHQLKVNHIIDCTHPFAQEISNNLMGISEELGIPYHRYERPLLNVSGYDTYDAIIDELRNTQGAILLTTGSNNLSLFDELKDRIYCRVLPTVNVINKCHDLGYNAKQIIGMQGPFDENMNRAMFESLKIKHLVTKASGKAGGFEEKVNAAKALNIKVYVLKRPDMGYSRTHRDLNELLREF